MAELPGKPVEMGQVDLRGHNELRLALMKHGFIPATLPAGDIAFRALPSMVVLIEYKGLAQFFHDIQTGTMMSQAKRMAEACDFPILMLEGSWARDDKGGLIGYGMTWRQGWNYLRSLWHEGISFELTSNQEHSIQRVLELWEYYHKDVHLSPIRSNLGNPKLAALCAFPKVGPTIAKALLAQFGSSFRAVVNAKPEALAEVKGIGVKRATALWQEFE